MDRDMSVAIGAGMPRTIVPVALVMPVKNEAYALADFFDVYADFTVFPSEVVFADAGSSDGTRQLLDTWCRDRAGAGVLARVVAVPGAGPGGGRNAGVEGSSAPLVAFIDAGIRAEPDWLARLVELMARADGQAAQGVCRFDADDPVGLAVCALTYGVGRIRPVLPASVFSRAVFGQAGLFDPTARAGEDIRWLAKVRIACGAPLICDSALVHYRRFPASLGAVFAKWVKYEESVTGTPVGRSKRVAMAAMCAALAVGLMIGGQVLFVVSASYLIFRGIGDPIRRSRDIFWWKRFPLALFAAPVVALAIDGGSLVGAFKGLFGRRASANP